MLTETIQRLLPLPTEALFDEATLSSLSLEHLQETTERGLTPLHILMTRDAKRATNFILSRVQGEAAETALRKAFNTVYTVKTNQTCAMNARPCEVGSMVLYYAENSRGQKTFQYLQDTATFKTLKAEQTRSNPDLAITCPISRSPIQWAVRLTDLPERLLDQLAPMTAKDHIQPSMISLLNLNSQETHPEELFKQLHQAANSINLLSENPARTAVPSNGLLQGAGRHLITLTTPESIGGVMRLIDCSHCLETPFLDFMAESVKTATGITNRWNLLMQTPAAKAVLSRFSAHIDFFETLSRETVHFNLFIDALFAAGTKENKGLFAELASHNSRSGCYTYLLASDHFNAQLTKHKNNLTFVVTAMNTLRTHGAFANTSVWYDLSGTETGIKTFYTLMGRKNLLEKLLNVTALRDGLFQALNARCTAAAGALENVGVWFRLAEDSVDNTGNYKSLHSLFQIITHNDRRYIGSSTSTTMAPFFKALSTHKVHWLAFVETLCARRPQGAGHLAGASALTHLSQLTLFYYIHRQTHFHQALANSPSLATAHREAMQTTPSGEAPLPGNTLWAIALRTASTSTCAFPGIFSEVFLPCFSNAVTFNAIIEQNDLFEHFMTTMNSPTIWLTLGSAYDNDDTNSIAAYTRFFQQLCRPEFIKTLMASPLLPDFIKAMNVKDTTTAWLEMRRSPCMAIFIDVLWREPAFIECLANNPELLRAFCYQFNHMQYSSIHLKNPFPMRDSFNLPIGSDDSALLNLLATPSILKYFTSNETWLPYFVSILFSNVFAEFIVNHPTFFCRLMLDEGLLSKIVDSPKVLDSFLSELIKVVEVVFNASLEGKPRLYRRFSALFYMARTEELTKVLSQILTHPTVAPALLTKVKTKRIDLFDRIPAPYATDNNTTPTKLDNTTHFFWLTRTPTGAALLLALFQPEALLNKMAEADPSFYTQLVHAMNQEATPEKVSTNAWSHLMADSDRVAVLKELLRIPEFLTAILKTKWGFPEGTPAEKIAAFQQLIVTQLSEPENTDLILDLLDNAGEPFSSLTETKLHARHEQQLPRLYESMARTTFIGALVTDETKLKRFIRGMNAQCGKDAGQYENVSGWLWLLKSDSGAAVMENLINNKNFLHALTNNEDLFSGFIHAISAQRTKAAGNLAGTNGWYYFTKDDATAELLYPLLHPNKGILKLLLNNASLLTAFVEAMGAACKAPTTRFFNFSTSSGWDRLAQCSGGSAVMMLLCQSSAPIIMQLTTNAGFLRALSAKTIALEARKTLVDEALTVLKKDHSSIAKTESAQKKHQTATTTLTTLSQSIEAALRKQAGSNGAGPSDEKALLKP